MTLLLTLGFVSGVLVGTVGVGGVLLAPGLVFAVGADAPTAAAAALATLVPAVVVDVTGGAWTRPTQEALGAQVVAGLATGAVVGACVVPYLSTRVVLFTAGLVAGRTGMRLLSPTRRTCLPGKDLGPAARFGLGGAVGMGSAMSGTSGPFVMLPLAIRLGLSMPAAIQLSRTSQLIVIPVTLVALSMSSSLSMPWGPVALLSAAVTAGSLAARSRVVQRLARRRGLVGVLLLAGGAMFTVRSLSP